MARVCTQQATQCLTTALAALYLQREWVVPATDGEWDYKMNVKADGSPTWRVAPHEPVERFVSGPPVYVERHLLADEMQLRVPN